MRWRLRFWFNKRDAKGRCTEPAPIDRDHHPIDEERYVFFHLEEDVRRLGQSVAKPGDTFELRLAPACIKCGKEQLDHTEAELQKKGWGGNGDNMICVPCGGVRGEPERKRLVPYPRVIQVPDWEAVKIRNRTRRENGVRTVEVLTERLDRRARLVEQLKQRVETLTKRLERLKQLGEKSPPKAAGEPRNYQWPLRRDWDEKNTPGAGEYTMNAMRGEEDPDEP